MNNFSAIEILQSIRRKEITVTNLVQDFIKHIERINPKLNAIQQFDPDRILLEAQQADKAIQRNENLGKLHGLPITLKDAFHVKGFKCSKGFTGFYGEVSDQDATVVARLKSEGAIILGITNVPELLVSYETDNLLYGRTNNPYDLSRTPGGSSGGEAAIIAGGGSIIGIGTDAGGSVRLPAHCCGIAAHKPTQYLVPLTGNFPNEGGIHTQIATIGPMARKVEDLMLIMEIISGTDNLDPHCIPFQFISPPINDLSCLKAVYFYGNKTITPSSDTIRVLDNAVSFLKTQLSSIHEFYLTPIDDVYRLHTETFMFGGDGGSALKSLLIQTNARELSPLLNQFLELSEKCEFST